MQTSEIYNLDLEIISLLKHFKTDISFILTHQTTTKYMMQKKLTLKQAHKGPTMHILDTTIYRVYVYIAYIYTHTYKCVCVLAKDIPKHQKIHNEI